MYRTSDDDRPPKLSGVVSMTKVNNRLRKLRPCLQTALRNARVNGQLQGCSGFVTDPATGRTVYLSTDVNHGTAHDALYRTARHTRDFTGGRNRFCAFGEIAEHVIELLDADQEWPAASARIAA